VEITNAQLILPDQIRRGNLTIRDGRIHKIRFGKPRKTRSETIDLRGDFLSPGFIDLHIHGAMGRDTMEATPEAFKEITEFHLRGGTTSLTLTTLSAAQKDILKVLEAATPFRNKSLGGSRIVGVHVEGPFISLEKVGAQNPEFVRNPSAREWGPILKYGKLVTQMTLAPELPRARALISALKKNGSIPSAGHTNADEKTLEPALKAGMNQSTHTFNAMSSVIKQGAYRAAGMLEFSLARDEIACELISDGEHVPPVCMRMLFNAKPRDKVVIITDATKGAGLKRGTKFELYGIKCRVTPVTATVVDGTGLAGSTLTMIRAIQTAVEKAGVPLVDAILAATQNPAHQLKRTRDLGSLAPGKRADLVRFNQKFKIKNVWLDGAAS